MQKEVPVVPFQSDVSSIQDYGIEIMSMDIFKSRRGNLDHSVEIPHQLAFNLIVFYTQGNTSHLVDFVWHEVKENTLIHIAKGQINAFRIHDDLEGFLILFTEEEKTSQLLI